MYVILTSSTAAGLSVSRAVDILVPGQEMNRQVLQRFARLGPGIVSVQSAFL